MAEQQKSRTPNRDKWFKKHAHRGMGVPESKNRRRAVEVSEPDTSNASTTALDDGPRTPTPTPTTATPTPPRTTPPSDRS